MRFQMAFIIFESLLKVVANCANKFCRDFSNAGTIDEFNASLKLACNAGVKEAAIELAIFSVTALEVTNFCNASFNCKSDFNTLLLSNTDLKLPMSSRRNARISSLHT